MGTNFYTTSQAYKEAEQRVAWRRFFHVLGVEEEAPQLVLRDLMLEHSRHIEKESGLPPYFDTYDGFDPWEEEPPGLLSTCLHIGKSSAGWAFSLHVIPSLGLTSWEAWLDHLSKPDVLIENEYGEVLTLEEFRSRVENRSHPNGLLRHNLDRHCIAHGEGSWDLIQGEFS